ncbi:MAG TPA: SpoIIE family protein phosphatase [Marmoricola sp.]|nr:SpoIIE family protein phosphatase [Marmoricola sp.]
MFEGLPTPCVLLDPALVIIDCNDAFRAVTGRSREGLVGRFLFDAFPDPDPQGEALSNVRRVLDQALRTGTTAVLGAQRYDIRPAEESADLEVRYWTTTAVPLLGEDGEVVALLYNVHDVTALAEDARGSRTGSPRARDLFRSAISVTEQAGLFDAAVIAERQLGMAVQDAMLPTQVPAPLQHLLAVRYRPASDVLHVGGDWYDVTQLDENRFAVAVGDVVGHGLGAAVLMGQLRAALNALTLAELPPSDALVGLDRYARQTSGGGMTTAVKLVIDRERCTITYSSAGHPPPVLLRPDGSWCFLDQAQGPALALPARSGTRPLACTEFVSGSRLVLYTDGLVERRGEHIEDSLRRLAERLRRGRDQSLDELADQLLEESAPSQTDDVALLLVQL